MQGRALFEYACRINHSCLPNCVWFDITTTTTDEKGKKSKFNDDGNTDPTNNDDGRSNKSKSKPKSLADIMAMTRRVVRYILPNDVELQDGEEYTIDYIESRMLPTHVRQTKLQNTKSFTCTCERCSNPIDTTRCVPCCNKTKNCDDGVHYVSIVDKAPVGLTNCTSCNHPCDTMTIEELQEHEDYIEQECLELTTLYDDEDDTNANHPDIQRRLLQLQPPHKYHYLASNPIFIVQANYYANNTDSKKKQIELLQNRVNCYEQVLGNGEDVYPNVLTAVAYEMLADATTTSAADATTENSSIAATTTTALQIYQKALRIFEITHGFDNEQHYRSCMAKVLQLQQQQQQRNNNNDNDDDSSSLTCCALCNKPATKKCSRCNQVVYCTRQHQRAHWLPVHKQQCCSTL